MNLKNRRLRMSVAAVSIPLLGLGALAAINSDPAKAASYPTLSIQLGQPAESIFIVATSTDATDLSNGFCLNSEPPFPAGTLATPYILVSGTSVTVDTFSDAGCTTGPEQQLKGTVPVDGGSSTYLLN